MKQLSKREKEVLALVSNGDTSKVIASKLFISARTVDKHIEHAKNKLGAKNSAHAVRLGIEQGCVTLSGKGINYIAERARLNEGIVAAMDDHIEQAAKYTGDSPMW